MASAETIKARIDFQAFAEFFPGFRAGMTTIAAGFNDSGLEPELRELIKIRASQLNGCAFCIQFHLNDARKLGVPAVKLDLLPAWRDAGIYSARELAALEWTERLTRLAQEEVEDEVYNRIALHFSPREIAFLTAAIAQINAWNRVAAPLRFTPPIPAARES